MNPWLTRALNIFLKPKCPLCDRAANFVFCKYCQRQIEDCQITKPASYWQGDLPLFAWGKYQGALKQSIAKLKYENRREIAAFYGEVLAAAWQQSKPKNLTDRLVVIPIPLHAEKLTARGFNQAEDIARSFCRITGDKLDLNLQRTRSTVAQFGLSKADRQANVADAFAINPTALRSGARILLIDDIYTTGATARSAAAALRSHQLDVCGIASVAVTIGSS